MSHKWEEWGVIHLGEASAAVHPYRDESLTKIQRLIEIDGEPVDGGWSPETARLLAIDVAMLAVRRHFNRLNELDRSVLGARLTEARRLVVEDRDVELSRIQADLEAYLGHGWSVEARSVWLIALNSVLPSPFRAALAAISGLLSSSPEEEEEISRTIRDRMRARLDEGVLLLEQPVLTTAIA